MFRELAVYKIAFELAMSIFHISKNFPKEEKYSLTDQIRRSSRSVCANIGEAYRKRKYKAHFISKLSDSDMENTETEIWIEFALQCGYIHKDQYGMLRTKCSDVGKLLNYMMNSPQKFLPLNKK